MGVTVISNAPYVFHDSIVEAACWQAAAIPASGLENSAAGPHQKFSEPPRI